VTTALVRNEAQPALVEALIRITKVDPEDLQALVTVSNASGKPVETLMVERGYATRADVMEAMSLARETAVVTKVSDLPAWDRLVGTTDEVRAGPLDVIFIGNSADPRKRGFLLLASDPANEVLAKRDEAGLSGRAVMAGFDFAGRISVTRGFIATLTEEWQQRQAHHSDSDLSAEQRAFDEICLDAFRRGASDIHLTVLDGRGFIAYRIDGLMEHVDDRPAQFIEAVGAAAYNTLVETGSTKQDFNPRDYQDASIERTYDVGRLRFRYSSLPLAPNGFDITLRIVAMGVETSRRSVESLGYSPDQEDKITRAFSNSAGMMLWVGTTGSGKSTSMAAVLERMAEQNPGKKIRTVEEPVESRIRGAYQTPVLKKNDDGSDFKAVLRQLMRSDPDVLMIGEIRDEETAHLAIQAVRTGHMALSTLHCQGATGVYDRLAGMGVNRSDLATVGLFLGFVFQQLVQRLCDDCKIPVAQWASGNPAHPILRRLDRLTGGDLAGICFESASGCARCEYRGRKGRTACAEILVPTPAICRAVKDGDSMEVWRLWRSEIDHADPSNMSGRTAFEHALWKMRQGMVSPFAVENQFKFVDEPAFYGEQVQEAEHGSVG